MTTFANLVTAIATDLRDPSNKTFSATAIGNFINEGVAEIGRIAPARLQQDITPIADTLSYVIGAGDPEIELKRVEVWDASQTPDKWLALLTPASDSRSVASATGWFFWNGSLYLTNAQEAAIVVGRDIIRVWGWGPYATVSGSTAMPMSNELEWAVRIYARMVALRSLAMSRNLYTQWQALPGNTSVTNAELVAQISQAEQEWHRRSRQIAILRGAN